MAGQVDAALSNGRPVTLWTVPEDRGLWDIRGNEGTRDGLVDNHVYTVEGIHKNADGAWMVTVRNPWSTNMNVGEGHDTASPTMELPLRTLTPEQQAPRALVEDVSRGGVTIEGERFFQLGKDVPWVSVSKRIDNIARQRGASAVALPGADPGKKLAQAWRGRDGRGVLIAMLGSPMGPTVAYFTVRFRDS